MDIQKALESEHSKAMTTRIVNYIGNDADLMAELMDCFFDDNGWRLNQRAAWPVSYIAEKYPTLIEPYLEKMLQLSSQPNVHDAIKRNTMRVLKELPEIPDDVLGLAADLSFRFLNDPSVAIAIRAFSMQVLAKICQKEPDLKEELRLTIEDFLQYDNKPAFKSAAKHALKMLKR